MTELLDPAFVRELELLRRRLSIRTRSGEMGERSANRRGSSAEFLEHRGYAPGDDLRRIDWLAYARSGQAVTKLYMNDEDAAVRLLLDASSSLDFGEPNKFLIARKLAAAVGYMALAGSQRAQLLVAREPDESKVTGVERALPVRRGRGALGSLLRELEEARAKGRADLARAVSVTLQRAKRPGLLVVLSDFLDPGPVTRALTQARAAGHEVVLIQVLAEEELSPSIEGDFSLEDAETGASVEVAVDASALEAYAARLAGLLEELRAWARRHGAAYVRARTDENLEDVVRRVVSRAID
jgi:uncharacterized protein (DUF58 family)